jgi:hypothetical protein
MTDKAYQNKVIKFLESMKPGQSFTLEKIVRKDNMQAFISIVSMYMDSEPFSDGLEFTEGYKQLRKVDMDFSKLFDSS